MVLRRQEELVGQPQHRIIRITYSHDSPDDFRALERLLTRFGTPITILVVCRVTSPESSARIHPAVHMRGRAL